MRLIDGDELKTAFPCGESVRTECVRATIDHMPTIEPKRKKGQWIHKKNIYGVVYCSECDYELHTSDTNFCPNCGADMRGE